MPVIELKGLKGLSGLSDSEKEAWNNAHPEFRNKSTHFKDRVYRNDLFVNKFGLDTFNKIKDVDTRDNMYRSSILNEYKENTFADEPELLDKLRSMTDDTFQDLIENKGIELDKDINSEYLTKKKDLEKKLHNSTGAPEEYISGLSMQLKLNEERYADRLKQKKEDIQKAIAKDSDAKLNKVSPLVDSIKKSYYEKLGLPKGEEGSITTADIDKEFEDLGNYSAHYRALKDTKFNDLTTDDKINLLSQFHAVNSSYGEYDQKQGIETALDVFNTKMQKHAADNTSGGEIFLDGLKAFSTTAVSNLAEGTIVPIAEAIVLAKYGYEGLQDFVEGNTGRNSIWSPRYWEMVSQSNNWTVAAQKEAEANGLVSDAVPTWDPSQDKKFWSAQTAYETGKMGGFAVSEAAKALLLKGVGRMTAAGATMTKTMEWGLRLSGGLGIGQAYAMGVYDDTKERLTNKNQSLLDSQLKEMLRPQYESKEAQNAINKRADEILKEVDEFNNKYGAEQGYKLISPDYAKSIATNEVLNQMMQPYLDANGNIDGTKVVGVNEDAESKQQIRDTALKAAAADLALETIRNAGIDFSFRKWMYKPFLNDASKFNKSTHYLLHFNENGAYAKYNKALTRAWSAAKAGVGGGWSNYADDLTSAFTTGAADSNYNNFLLNKDNPEAAVGAWKYVGALLNGITNDAVAGVDELIEMAQSDQARYDAEIGTTGSIFSFMPAGLSTFYGYKGKTRQKLIADYLQQHGRDHMTMADHINLRINNPLTSGWVDALDKEARTEKARDTYTKIVSKRKDDIDKFIQSAILMSSDFAIEGTTKYDEANQREANAIDLVSLLNDMDAIENSNELPGLRDIYTFLDRWTTNGYNTNEQNIKSKKAEDVVNFLAANKLEDTEENRALAQQRLEDNAKHLLELKEKRQEILDKIDSKSDNYLYSTELRNRLVKAVLMKENYQERLDKLSEELDISKKSSFLDKLINKMNLSSEDAVTPFGNKAHVDKALNTEREELEYHKKTLETVNKEIESLEKQLKQDKGKQLNEEEAKTHAITEGLLASNKAKKKILEKTIDNRTTYINQLEEVAKAKEKAESEGKESNIISKDEILNMHPEDMAFILNDDNRKYYSKRQLQEIDQAKAELEERGADWHEKLDDASRLSKNITEVSDIYSTLKNNPREAEALFQEIERKANVEQVKIILREATKKRFTDMDNAKSDDELFDLAIKTHPSVLNEYLENIKGKRGAPRKREIINRALQVAKTTTNIADAIDSLDDSEMSQADKAATKRSISTIVKGARSVEEVFSKIEDEMVSPDTPKEAKKLLDKVLKASESIGYLRDTEKLKQKEKTAKKEYRKKERERKKAEAKAKAEEEAKKATEELPVTIDDTDEVTDLPLEMDEGESNTPTESKPLEDSNKPTSSETTADNTAKTTSATDTSSTNISEPTTPTTSATNNSSEEAPASTQEEKTKSNTDSKQTTTVAKPVEATPIAATVVTTTTPVNTDTKSVLEVAESDTSGKVTIETRTKDTTDMGNTEEVSSDVILNGNKFPGYAIGIAKESGALIPVKSEKEGDALDKYHKWLQAEKIKLQDIIDNELYDISKVAPDIYLMAANTDTSASNDGVHNVVFLVVPYTDAVAKIHDESLGGVIRSNNKEYLIIGNLGYNGNIKAQQDAYINMTYPVKSGRTNFFKEHPTDRFYVDTSRHTKIVDGSFMAGRRVRQLSSQSSIKERRLSELADGKKSEYNPMGLDLEDLAFMIQEPNNIVTINTSGKKFYPPSDTDSNIGNVFALVKAANGNYVPIYIKATYLNEITVGSALYNRIGTLLNELMSPDFRVREAAKMDLSRLIVLQNDKNQILYGSEKNNVISIISKGVEIFKSELGANFDKAGYLRAITAMNPRINITSDTLKDESLLKMYDEAGALKTDLAKLGTANSKYSVHTIKEDGTPDVTVQIKNTEPNLSHNTNTMLADKKATSIRYQGDGNTYRLDNGVWRDSVGNVISDSNMIKQLELALKTRDKNPDASKDGIEVYIMNRDAENPEVVVNRNGKYSTLSKEDAANYINKYNEKLAKEEAKKKAKEAMEAEKKREMDEAVATGEEVTWEGAPEGEINTTIEDNLNAQAKSINRPTTEVKPPKKEEKPAPVEEAPKAPTTDINSSKGQSLAELQTGREQKTVTTVKEILFGKRSEEIYTILDEKFANDEVYKKLMVNDSIDNIVKFLESKGVATTGITSIENLIKEIKECV